MWADSWCEMKESSLSPVLVWCFAHLKHVGVGVMCIFHYNRMTPGQCVGDAVLAFVA